MLTFLKTQSRPCLGCLCLRNTFRRQVCLSSYRRLGIVSGQVSKDRNRARYHLTLDNKVSSYSRGLSYHHNFHITGSNTPVRHIYGVKSRLPLITPSRWLRTSSSASHQFILSEVEKEREVGGGVRCHSKSAAASQKEIEEKDREWTLPKGLDTGIKMYNSLTRKKEPLILPMGRHISWWVILHNTFLNLSLN